VNWRKQILRPKETSEGIAVPPKQKELEQCDDERRRKTFRRHEDVENPYVEDDCGEDR
jgi:hypothetical protein